MKVIEAKKPKDWLGGAWVIILDKKKENVLMAKRSSLVNNPGAWNFFGGNIDSGELARDTAVRETFEESGLTFRPDQMKMLYQEKDRFFYYVTVKKEKVEKNLRLNNEHTEAKWFSLQELPKKVNNPTAIVMKSSELRKLVKKVR